MNETLYINIFEGAEQEFTESLNIFVYDVAIIKQLISKVKHVVKKVMSFFKYIYLILANGVIGFSIDINSPPYLEESK